MVSSENPRYLRLCEALLLDVVCVACEVLCDPCDVACPDCPVECWLKLLFPPPDPADIEWFKPVVAPLELPDRKFVLAPAPRAVPVDW
jgi:hypothetical protein